MTMEHTEQSKARVFLPWVVAAAMLLVYFLTLNHWVTLTSLPVVAKLTGWDWHPFYLDWRPGNVPIQPLYYVFTYPIRFLQESSQPVAMNAFSALCAALTLAVLARSVSLLPQDRTRDQRHREPGAYGLLSLRGWWLPPLMAVSVCALELTFWEHATAATSEMLDLLIFAYLIRCLLEYRLTQKESWLTKFALVYGIGITNNWALLGYLPFFIGAIVWIKGVAFFNLRFLGRMAGIGALGLSFYLLLPAIETLADPESGGFWHLVHQHLAQQKLILKSVPRWVALVLSLSTLVPVIIAGIRWPSFQGDLSPSGKLITNIMFRVVHFVFLALGILIFFDLKYSPRGLFPNVSLLSFYYLGALTVGYYSGYALLVYGKEPMKDWQRSSGALRLLNKLMIAVLWLALLGVPAGLVYRNLPHIKANNTDVLGQFANATLASLPAKGAIVLSDDPNRLLLIQAIAHRSGKVSGNIFIESGSDVLPYGIYHQYLYKAHPELRNIIPPPDKVPKAFEPRALVQFLQLLNRQWNLYYLHPSFGAYFEHFYMRPHGLCYELKPFGANELTPPPLTPDEIRDNENFWNGLKSELEILPTLAKKSTDVATLNIHYSRALNYWGTELQKAHRLKEAGERFAQSLLLNPDNVIAQINGQFNTGLQQGKVQPVQTDEAMDRKLHQYRSWESAYNFNGPFDEPDFNLRFGQLLAEGDNLRQAAALFQRVLVLRPGDPEAQLSMAKTHVDLGQPDQALKLVQDLRAKYGNTNDLEVSRVEALAYYQKNDYSKAEKIFQTIQATDPKDQQRLVALAEFYRVTGYSAQRLGQTNVARERFNHALAALDQVIAVAPDNIDAFIRKSELQMQAGAYDKAIQTLDDLLRYHPSNVSALMNRAIAEMQSKRYDAAKRDYQSLQKLVSSHVYSVYYGLGEIAVQQRDESAARKNYKLYLKYAPAGTPEYKQVMAKLEKLETSGLN